MMSSNIPAPQEVGLNGDAALRYALVHMVVASPHCMPNSYLPTVEALYEYIKVATTARWVDGMKCRFVDGILERVEAPPSAASPYAPDFSTRDTDPFHPQNCVGGMSRG